MSFTMPPLTDRQRVEITLPARMLFTLHVCNCYADPDEAVVEKLGKLLVKACTEALDDLPEKAGSKIARRIERIHEAVTKDMDDQAAAKVGLTIYYFVKDLIDREVLVLWDGSAFGEAINTMIPMFDYAFDVERMDKSARKQARRLLELLQREGYYRQ